MSRHERRRARAQARKFGTGFQALESAAHRLKGLEALPDSLKDLQEVLGSVNEMRATMAGLLTALNEYERKTFILEKILLEVVPKFYANAERPESRIQTVLQGFWQKYDREFTALKEHEASEEGAAETEPSQAFELVQQGGTPDP